MKVKVIVKFSPRLPFWS